MNIVNEILTYALGYVIGFALWDYVLHPWALLHPLAAAVTLIVVLAAIIAAFFLQRAAREVP